MSAIALSAMPDWPASGDDDDLAHVRLRTSARARWLDVAAGQAIDAHLAGKFAYLVVKAGAVVIGRHRITRHDGLAIRNKAGLMVAAETPVSLMLIEA